MGKTQDIREYVYGETVGIGLELRDRDGAALNLTGSPSITFVVYDEKRTKLLTISTAAGILVTNAAVGEALLTISPDRQRGLRPETNYGYDLWSDTVAEGKLHQATGTFRLKWAGQP